MAWVLTSCRPEQPECLLASARPSGVPAASVTSVLLQALAARASVWQTLWQLAAISCTYHTDVMELSNVASNPATIDYHHQMRAIHPGQFLFL